MKMYCIFSKEAVDQMGGNRGKLAAMAGHAYLHAWYEGVGQFDDASMEYMNSGRAVKIALIVNTTEELHAIQDSYRNVCATSLVTDSAKTVFNEPTTVCLGLGPIRDNDIGEDLKGLKVFI